MDRLRDRIAEEEKVLADKKVPLRHKLEREYDMKLDECQMRPAEFAKIIKLRGGEESLFASKHYETLEKMHRNHVKFSGECLPVIRNRDSLADYCEENPLKPGCCALEVITKAGHLEVAEAAAKVIFGTD
jgi:hypothetical protein